MKQRNWKTRECESCGRPCSGRKCRSCYLHPKLGMGAKMPLALQESTKLYNKKFIKKNGD